MMFKKILIQVDDSDCSYQAAKVGFKMAKELGAEVLLLYVIDEKYLIANPEFRTSYVDIFNLHLEQAENVTKHILKDLGEGVNTSIEMPRSSPSTSIIEWADTWGADLIVIGTHGKSEIAKIFMGSTSQYVIKHAKVPCLVIREKQ